MPRLFEAAAPGAVTLNRQNFEQAIVKLKCAPAIRRDLEGKSVE